MTGVRKKPENSKGPDESFFSDPFSRELKETPFLFSFLFLSKGYLSLQKAYCREIIFTYLFVVYVI